MFIYLIFILYNFLKINILLTIYKILLKLFKKAENYYYYFDYYHYFHSRCCN